MSLLVISRPPPAPPVVARPLTNTFSYSPLPPNAALHPNSAAIGAEVLRQSKIALPVINGGQTPPIWSSHCEVVPRDQPVLPGVCTHDTTMSAIAATGIPIPPDIYIPPAPDTDKAIIIYQPDAPNGGFMWEAQGFGWITPGVQWHANSLSRMGNVNSRDEGRFVSYVGGPGGSTPGALYSTWESSAWGTQGSGLPYAPGLLTRDDILRGYVDHALLLEVFDAAAGQHVWPAMTRGDGGAAPGTPAATLIEGMWLRLAADVFIDPAWPDMDRLYAQGTRDFGALLTDRTLSCLGFRLATDAHDLNDDYHLLHFPFGSLQALAVGSDTTWHPLAS